MFPIYVFASKVDGVSFSDDTVWEGKIFVGENYRYFQDKIDYQYIK
jgi:hypothetical protein